MIRISPLKSLEKQTHLGEDIFKIFTSLFIVAILLESLIIIFIRNKYEESVSRFILPTRAKKDKIMIRYFKNRMRRGDSLNKITLKIKNLKIRWKVKQALKK